MDISAYTKRFKPLNFQDYTTDPKIIFTVGILTRINGMCAIRREQQQASLYECTSCKT